jgi:hypothetical protein
MSAPSQTVFSIGYDFHFVTEQPAQTTATSGGNNYKDNTRNQSFTYDLLNRLTSAQNAGTDCTRKTLNPNQTEHWGNNYGYDPGAISPAGCPGLSRPFLSHTIPRGCPIFRGSWHLVFQRLGNRGDKISSGLKARDGNPGCGFLV